MKINHKAQEIKEAPKKVGVPFKSTTCEKDEGSSNDEEGEEEMTMFAKKFKKFMKFNKAERFRRRDIIKGEPSKKGNKSIIFYECKKSSHIKFDYPQLKKKGALKQNKKAMMATWSYNDSSDSDEDNEVANLCFMVIEKPKVILNSSELNEYTFEELQDAFNELAIDFETMISKYKKMISKLNEENNSLIIAKEEIEKKFNDMQAQIDDLNKN
ncbi:hypothetical protein V6Z12_A06G114900 [Gossypium hirsutum]